jgi:hypothetical protein
VPFVRGHAEASERGMGLNVLMLSSCFTYINVIYFSLAEARSMR